MLEHTLHWVIFHIVQLLSSGWVLPHLGPPPPCGVGIVCG